MMVIMGYISTTAASVASKEEQVITLKVNVTLSTKSKTEPTFPVVSGILNQLDLLIATIQNILDIVMTVTTFLIC